MYGYHLLLLADVQKQGVSIQHDAVGGVRDDGSNLTSNLNLPELNESRLVLDGYFIIRQNNANSIRTNNAEELIITDQKEKEKAQKQYRSMYLHQ